MVVDNGSTDYSVPKIRAAHPDIFVIETGRNLGFAGGNNVGLRHAIAHGAQYCWLLNNDTLPAPGALDGLIAKALTDKQIAAVASVCYYAEAPSIVQAWAGARINLWCGYARNSKAPRCDDWFDALYGASMLVSASALQDAGLLDEGFFFYLEETELCLRFRKKGWRLAAAPESRVLHKVHASTGGHQPVLERYFTTSGLRILSLHSPAPRLASFLFLFSRFTRRLMRLQLSRCQNVWAGLQDYLQTRPVLQKIR